MIKAKYNDGTLLFGLSKENLSRLQNDEPIMFNLKDMGLEDRKIIICFGETEDDIYLQMLPNIDIDKTKFNYDLPKDKNS